MSKKSGFCYKRLAGELSKLNNNPIEGIKIDPTDDMLIWIGSIKGPPDTPYQEGDFPLIIRFTENYPIKPPSIKFLEPKKIFHPNFYKDGKICIDILQSNWSPALNVEKVLLSIRSLLMDPNPSSPANREAANLLNSNYEEYCQRVKQLINS